MQKTSGSILKHFLSCRWQLPYIWGHDSPRKWNLSRWLIKWQLTQLRPRKSLKVLNEESSGCSLLLFQKEFIQVNVIQEFIEERGKDSKEVFEWVFAVTWFWLQLFELRELTDSSELILNWKLYLFCCT